MAGTRVSAFAVAGSTLIASSRLKASAASLVVCRVHQVQCLVTVRHQCWVERDAGIVRRTAQAYIALAKLADDNGAAIALLPPTTAHRLAAKPAPHAVVSEVVAKALSLTCPR
jgi:hypothetical protein